MIITYDKKADAAYIYLSQDINEEVAFTYPINPEGGEIYVDVNDQGRIIGFDISDASKKIPEYLLKEAIDIKELQELEKPDPAT